MSNRSLDTYFENTKNFPPHKLLQEALPFVLTKDRALDLGAGALRDSKLLLAGGFKEVVAVDASKELSAMAEGVGDQRLTAVTTRFEEYQFPPEYFDLVSSQFALPFCDPEEFAKVFESLLASLVPGGVFTGQLFGDRDRWAGESHKAKTFLTREQAEQVLAGLDVRKFNEVERDSLTADQTPKHWHYFEIIAIKK